MIYFIVLSQVSCSEALNLIVEYHYLRVTGEVFYANNMTLEDIKIGHQRSICLSHIFFSLADDTELWLEFADHVLQTAAFILNIYVLCLDSKL